MANVRIARDYFRDATLVESPAMSSTLPSTNAQVTARDQVARSTSNGDQVIRGHFNGQGRKFNSLWLFRHNGYGGKVRLQLHKYADYTVDVYDSAAQYIVSAVSPIDDGSWGVAPLGVPINDQLITEAPHCAFFADTVAESFTLTFTRCQQSYWQFGRIMLGNYRELPDNPDTGAVTMAWADNRALSRGRGASLRLRAGDRWRELAANMYFLTDANRAIWRDYMALIQNEDVAVSLRPSATGREERDHIGDFLLKQHAPFTWTDGDFHNSTINFIEV